MSNTKKTSAKPVPDVEDQSPDVGPEAQQFYLTIGDERFKVHETVPTMALLRMQKADRLDPMKQGEALLNFLDRFIHEDEHERFDAYVDDHGTSFEQLGDAIGQCVTEVMGTPFVGR